MGGDWIGVFVLFPGVVAVRDRALNCYELTDGMIQLIFSGFDCKLFIGFD